MHFFIAHICPFTYICWLSSRLSWNAKKWFNHNLPITCPLLPVYGTIGFKYLCSPQRRVGKVWYKILTSTANPNYWQIWDRMRQEVPTSHLPPPPSSREVFMAAIIYHWHSPLRSLFSQTHFKNMIKPIIFKYVHSYVLIWYVWCCK